MPRPKRVHTCCVFFSLPLVVPVYLHAAYLSFPHSLIDIKKCHYSPFSRGYCLWVGGAGFTSFSRKRSAHPATPPFLNFWTAFYRAKALGFRDFLMLCTSTMLLLLTPKILTLKNFLYLSMYSFDKIHLFARHIGIWILLSFFNTRFQCIFFLPRTGRKSCTHLIYALARANMKSISALNFVVDDTFVHI